MTKTHATREPLQLSRPVAIVLSIFVILGCDQVTKIVARKVLAANTTSDYMGGALRIQLAENTGAFLSIGAGMDEHWRLLAFTFAVAIFLAIATFALFRKKQMQPMMTAGLTLLIAGGLGNLIDRLVYGYVTDFLNVGIGSLRTGIFNVADMAIMLGVGLLFFAGDGEGKKPHARKAK